MALHRFAFGVIIIGLIYGVHAIVKTGGTEFALGTMFGLSIMLVYFRVTYGRWP